MKLMVVLLCRIPISGAHMALPLCCPKCYSRSSQPSLGSPSPTCCLECGLYIPIRLSHTKVLNKNKFVLAYLFLYLVPNSPWLSHACLPNISKSFSPSKPCSNSAFLIKPFPIPHVLKLYSQPTVSSPLGSAPRAWLPLGRAVSSSGTAAASRPSLARAWCVVDVRLGSQD